jgi:hypothetical protein
MSEQWRERYSELLRVVDPDALHDLVVRHGPEILERDLPYLVVAARNQRRGKLRRGAARYEVPSADVRAGEAAGSVWDPLARVVARETLRELLAELAELDPRDVLALWSHAAGRTDAEIVAEWDALGFEPANPSEASIRQRRSRTRQRLRERLGLTDDESP